MNAEECQSPLTCARARARPPRSARLNRHMLTGDEWGAQDRERPSASYLSETDRHHETRRCARDGVGRENETGGAAGRGVSLSRSSAHPSPAFFRSSAEWHFLDHCYTSARTAAIVMPPRAVSPPWDIDLALFERKHLHFYTYVCILWRFTMYKDNLALKS